MSENHLDDMIRDHERLVHLITTSPGLESWERQGMLALSERIGMYDPLTRLLNKAYVEKRLREEVSRAKRHGAPLTVIMLDIDNFKLYNGGFGQQQGDIALAHVGRVLNERHSLGRSEDIMGRYGGEEFLVILPATDLNGAVKVAEDLCTAVKSTPIEKYVGIEDRRHVKYEGDKGFQNLSVSAGIAAYSPSINTPELLLNKANETMQKAKELNRGSFSIHS